MFYDYYYFVLVLPAFVVALIAQAYLKSVYRKMSTVFSVRGITGAQAAHRVLQYYGINNVTVEPVAGTLSDHFDPRSNVIRLSQGVYSSNSIAAIGIACHEAGHAANTMKNMYLYDCATQSCPLPILDQLWACPLQLLVFLLIFFHLLLLVLFYIPWLRFSNLLRCLLNLMRAVVQ